MEKAGFEQKKVSLPLWLLAEVSYRCPLHCVYCYNPVDYATYGNELSTEDWLRVLRQGRELGDRHAVHLDRQTLGTQTLSVARRAFRGRHVVQQPVAVAFGR